MKHKRTYICIFSLLMLLILGFNLYFHLCLNRFDGVAMRAIDGSAHAEGVSVVLDNQTVNDVECGNASILRLQRRILGVWFPVWRDFTVGHSGEAFGYDAEASHKIDLNWKYSYGAKNSGHYRVIKEFWVRNTPGEIDKFLLSAEFFVT